MYAYYSYSVDYEYAKFIIHRETYFYPLTLTKEDEEQLQKLVPEERGFVEAMLMLEKQNQNLLLFSEKPAYLDIASGKVIYNEPKIKLEKDKEFKDTLKDLQDNFILLNDRGEKFKKRMLELYNDNDVYKTMLDIYNIVEGKAKRHSTVGFNKSSGNTSKTDFLKHIDNLTESLLQISDAVKICVNGKL